MSILRESILPLSFVDSSKEINPLLVKNAEKAPPVVMDTSCPSISRLDNSMGTGLETCLSFDNKPSCPYSLFPQPYT